MTTENRYTGSCHCHRIKFSFIEADIESGVRCTCSLCEKKGALMSSFVLNSEKLHINANDDDLGCYQFGEKISKHYFCKHCGIYTFHAMRSQPGKMKVNLGCIDGVNSLHLPFVFFDGKNLLS